MKYRPTPAMTSALLFGAAAAMLLLVVIPQESAARAAFELLAQERALTRAAQEQRSNAVLAKTQFERLQETLSQLDRGFVAENTVLVFIEALEQTADVSGVTQEIRNFQVPARGTTTTTIQLDVQGTFSQILQYVRRLEALATYLAVDGMQIAGTSAEGQASISATFDVRVHWQ